MENVTISKKEYERLQKDSEFLNALREAGVDNWGGYSYAVDLFGEDEDEDE